MRILVTGATGKVGQALIRRLLGDESLPKAEIRALTHSRSIEGGERLSSVRGSIEDRETCRDALA